MRTRINNITFTSGTRSINTGITSLTIDDIRLIVNESQNKVICSSMQKSNITNISNGIITYSNSIPVLASGDHITFEVDLGDNCAKLGSNSNVSLTSVDEKIDDFYDTFDADMALQLQGIIGEGDSVGGNSQTEGEIERLRTLQESYDALSRSEIGTELSVGKQQLASAITAKGVSTSSSDALSVMASNVSSIQNVTKEFNVSDISQGWLGMPGTLELIAQYYDAQYPYAQAYILAQGTSVTAITGCKRIVYSDSGSVFIVDNPSGAYTIGAYSDEGGIGFAVLMFDTPVMQNAPISNNANVFEFGCKDATIEFGGMNSANVRMCRFDGCDITMQAGALQSSRICIFDIGNSDITFSGSTTFNGCTQLQSVSLPNVVTISGSGTFQGCTQLQSVSLPNVVTISGSTTFNGCSNLQSIILPNVTTISGSSTFQSCTQLQSVSLPNVVTISGGYAFNVCTQLQNISLPNIVNIGNIFQSCPNLIDIELGAAIEASFSLSTWNPTNVLADQAKKAQMLQNIREHIAANLPDRTGQSALTLTMSANIKAAIQADTATSDAFTNKNWVIA